MVHKLYLNKAICKTYPWIKLLGRQKPPVKAQPTQISYYESPELITLFL